MEYPQKTYCFGGWEFQVSGSQLSGMVLDQLVDFQTKRALWAQKAVQLMGTETRRAFGT